MAKQVKHDKFCWRCCEQDTTLKCLSCPRSYHSECLKNKQENIGDKEIWRCPVCVRLDLNVIIDNKERLDMLPIIIDQAFKEEKFDSLKHPLTDGKDPSRIDGIVNLIDLTTIKETIDTCTSFFGLIANARWILHNAFILFSENDDKVKAARELVDFLKMEIKRVEMCAGCYLNETKHPDNGFLMVCSKAHIVLWAKVSGWDYWPAKCMSIDEQTVNVRFFGDQTEADVPASSCYLFSETRPRSRSSTIPKRMQKGYKDALKDANEYIENIRRIFGSYRLVEKQTVFDPSLLNQYFSDAIPGYVDSQEAPKDSTGRSPCESCDNDLNEAESDEEPLKKKVRLSAKSEPVEKKLVVEPNVGNVEDSMAKAPVDESKVDQTINAEIATLIRNVAKSQEAMLQVTKSFDNLRDLNQKMLTELQKMATKYDQQLKDSEERNRQLVRIHYVEESEYKKVIDQQKTKIGELVALNGEKVSEYNRLMSEYNKMVAEKDKERMEAINETKSQCEEDYSRALEVNKKMKFCAACDTAKQQDTFYFCNQECQKNYWIRKMDK